jgi:hypothetical protein
MEHDHCSTWLSYSEESCAPELRDRTAVSNVQFRATMRLCKTFQTEGGYAAAVFVEVGARARYPYHLAIPWVLFRMYSIVPKYRAQQSQFPRDMVVEDG